MFHYVNCPCCAAYITHTPEPGHFEFSLEQPSLSFGESSIGYSHGPNGNCTCDQLDVLRSFQGLHGSMTVKRERTPSTRFNLQSPDSKKTKKKGLESPDDDEMKEEPRKVTLVADPAICDAVPSQLLTPSTNTTFQLKFSSTDSQLHALMSDLTRFMDAGNTMLLSYFPRPPTYCLDIARHPVEQVGL